MLFRSVKSLYPMKEHRKTRLSETAKPFGEIICQEPSSPEVAPEMTEPEASVIATVAYATGLPCKSVTRPLNTRPSWPAAHKPMQEMKRARAERNDFFMLSVKFVNSVLV